MTKSPECKGVDFEDLEKKYKNDEVIRTLTCLNKNGHIGLYFIKNEKENKNKIAINFLNSLKEIDKNFFEEVLQREIENKKL